MVNKDFNNADKLYTINDMATILRDMADYFEECRDNNDESVYGYFAEMCESGLFHDAIGKVCYSTKDKVGVWTEY